MRPCSTTSATPSGGATFDPQFDADRHAAFVGRVAAPERPPSVAGSAKVKFVRPVFPGNRLDYDVRMTRRLDHTAHFSLDATVDGDPVVRGSFTTARLEGHTWAS